MLFIKFQLNQKSGKGGKEEWKKTWDTESKMLNGSCNSNYIITNNNKICIKQSKGKNSPTAWKNKT